MQGHHLDANELIKISNKLFGKSSEWSINEMIGIAARLAIDDELER